MFLSKYITINIMSRVLTNRGFGAGGSNTNKNGLSYENKTHLSTEYSQYKLENGYKYIKFLNNENEYITTTKNEFHKYMKKINERNLSIETVSGCKEPDEVYIDNIKKNIFIIEKKFQARTGSIDEKIQTGLFKKFHFLQLFPNYNTHYIYCLSDWYKKKDYHSVLIYLQENNIPIFWGDEKNYKNNIIQYIINNS